jgi:hypothetical protein
MRTLSLFLAMLITLSLVFSAPAQHYYAGFMGGLNFADLNLKAASGTDQLTSPRTEYGIGGMIGRNISNTLSIELDVLYLRKGGTQMATSNNPDVDVTMSVLEVPLFIKATFGSTVRPYVKARVRVSVLF